MYEQNGNSWNSQKQQSQQPTPGNLLATASLVCAILGIISVCCLYGAFIFGGLAVIFGLLSRGARKSTVAPAKTAMYLGVAAILISAVVTAASFAYTIRQYGGLQNLLDAYTYTMENTFGIDMTPEDNSSSGQGTDGSFL